MKLYQEFLIGQDKNVIKEIDVCGAVILKINEEGCKSVLLIKRAPDDHFPNSWEFPRGRCRNDEQMKECLKREVKEETNLEIEIGNYINNYQYIADKGTRKSTQYNYLCKLKNSNQEVKLSKEHSEYRWIQSFGEIELLTSWNELKRTICQVLNIDNSIVTYPKIKEIIKETQKSWIKK